MNRFVSHHNPLKYESMSFESIFTCWDLKKSVMDRFISYHNPLIK